MPERDALPNRVAEGNEAKPEVQRLRQHAAMLRQLAKDAAAPSIAGRLLDVAADLERRAALLEQR